MAARSNALFLQVGGNVDQLAVAMKAGRSVMNEFGGAASDTVAEVEKAFQQLGGGDIEQSARAMEASYTRAFANIRANAQSVAEAPSGSAALQILNAGAAQQAASAAEAQAAGLRMVAEAAARAAESTTGDAAAARTYATAAEAAAIGAEHHAVALRAQAGVLTGVEVELRSAGAAHDEVEHASKRMSLGQMEMMHVVRASSDALAAGAPITQIFAMEIGRVAEAAAFSGGALGKVGEVLAGPWGLALTAGIAILTPFIGKLIEGNDELGKATDKLEKEAHQTEINDLAHQAFSRTLEGQIALQRELNRELDKAVQTQRQQQQTTLFSTQKNLGDLQNSRDDLASQVYAQRRTVRSLANAKPTGDDSDAAAAIAAAAAEAKLAELEGKLAKVTKSIADAQRAVREAEVPLIQNDVAASFDAKALAVERYNKKLGELNNLLAIGAGNSRTVQVMGGDGTFRPEVEKGISRETYRAQLAAITAERKAAEAAASSAKKTAADNRQSGREIDLSQAESIVHGIGGVVTSGQRSRAKQQQLYDAYIAGNGPLAAKPGTSEHETGQALDIRKTVGMTLGKIVKAFEDQGVHLSEKLDEGDHFHVAWGKKGPSQDTIDKRAEATAQKQIRDDEAFAQLKGRAQESLLGLMRAQVTDIGAAADLDARQIEIEHQRLDSAAQAGVAEKHWSQAKADELLQLNQANAELKTDAVRRKEAHDLVERQLSTDVRDLEGKQALLEIQGRLAKTRKEQLEVDLKLLALHEEELAKQAKSVLKDPFATPGDKDKAIDTLKGIDDQHAGNVHIVQNQHLDAVQSYRDQLVRSVGDMNDALKGVEADGLKGLEDGLAGILTGTESIGSAFKKMADSIIADLIRIGVQKLILSLFGDKGGAGSGSGSDSGSGGGGGFLGVFESLAKGLFGHADGLVPGYASGLVDGVVRGPGTGRSDSILAMMGMSPIRLSNGESIMTEAATRRFGPMLKAMNDNGVPGFATGFVPDSAIFMPQLPTARDTRPEQQVVVHLTSHNDFRGADADAVARLEARMDERDRMLQGQIITTVRDARERKYL